MIHARMRTSRHVATCGLTRRALIYSLSSVLCGVGSSASEVDEPSFSTLVYANEGGRGPATCVYVIIVSWPATLTVQNDGRNLRMRNLRECAARRGNFEITI